MKKDKKVSDGTMAVLYGICAVIWMLRSILDLIDRTYEDSIIIFVLNALCAVIWTVGFILYLRRYLASKKQ